jgi:oligopeptide transport system permease protein
VTAFVVRRAVWFAIILWIVFTVSFVLMRSVPGGPFASDRKLDPIVEASLRARYNLDYPLPKQ